MMLAQALRPHRLHALAEPLLRHAHREFLRHGSGNHRVLGALDELGGAIGEMLCRLEVGRDFDKRPAEPLMIEEALAEGVPPLCVIDRDAERFRDHAAAHGRDIGASAVNAGERTLKRLAWRIKQRVVIDADTAQSQSAGADCMPAHERVGTDSLDTWCLQIDEKGGDSSASHRGRRPAPLQVHYLGYPGTIGGDALDYLIADRIVVPPGAERCFTEQLVFLDGCYQVNDRRRLIAAETPSRAQASLPENGFVFCCFNNNYKITPAVFDVWMRLLAAVEGSVLWLLADRGSEDNLRREASSRGVDPHRLVFAPRLPLAAHLARHRLADLFLDTVPVNAHTTASDALWAGLPLMTCAGRSFVARVAASLLSALGLAELITTDLKQYEVLALALARDPARLAELRRRLEAARLTAPLFDTARTCRQLETAYLTMSEISRRGDPPRSFTVPSP